MSVTQLPIPRGPRLIQQPPPLPGQAIDEAGREAWNWVKENPEVVSALTAMLSGIPAPG